MKIAVTALGRYGAAPMYSFGMAKALSAKAEVLCIVSSYAENIHLWRKEAESNPSFSVLEIPTYRNLPEFVINSFDFTRFRKIRKAIRAFAPDILYSPFMHFWEKFIFPKRKEFPENQNLPRHRPTRRRKLGVNQDSLRTFRV